MKSVIVGTAGHIDHGKTALVRALTGIDADRLEEEKRRGITIDIGFAHLELPSLHGKDKLRLGFVDVPGHEKFVRNMLAGIGGIDMVLLVIAADEGVMPQTREHFDICRMLNVQRGITVVTKSDAVDADTLEVARLEIEEFLRGSFLDSSRAPMVNVSSLTGAGIEELKRELARVAGAAPARDSNALTRLPIDRAFTMKGFGNVITGTLVSGMIKKEQELELFPAGKRVRVRGVQVHGTAAEQAVAGQRTALNLAGVELEELARGMTLSAPGTFRTAKRFDVALNLLPSAKPLKDRARVHLHAYTSETIAEVALVGAKQLEAGATGFAQLRTAEPLLLLPGDRFIVRQFSPVITIGGGEVLDAAPLKRRMTSEERTGFLRSVGGELTAALTARIARRGEAGASLADLVAETGKRPEDIERAIASGITAKNIVRLQDSLVSAGAFEAAKRAAVDQVKQFHTRTPLVAGISKEQLREELGLPPQIFAGVLDALVREKKIDVTGEQVRAFGHGVVMKDDEAQSKSQIEQAFASAGLKVPALKEVLAGLKVDRMRAQQIVTLLLRDKTLVKVSEELVFHRDALGALRRQIGEYRTKSPKIDVTKFKDLTGVSRKYAIPLLEYLDRERVTRRVGDERVIL